MKKRAVSVLLAAAVTMAAVTGCGGTGEGGATPAENTETDKAETADDAEDTAAAGEGSTDGSSYKIAVVKQMDHASLDEIASAVCEELDTIAAENGIRIEYEVYSGDRKSVV